MWELMNGMANNMRNRWMPRRSNGLGTMTAMVIGASVGIAAWETLRRTRQTGQISSDTVENAAAEVINQLG